jgi:hypothetical protein
MNKKYYVHALQGYQRSSYVRKGPYRYEWLAYLVAHWFRFYIGSVLITTTVMWLVYIIALIWS